MRVKKKKKEWSESMQHSLRCPDCNSKELGPALKSLDPTFPMNDDITRVIFSSSSRKPHKTMHNCSHGMSRTLLDRVN